MVMDESGNDETWRSCFQQLGRKLLLYARQWVGSPSDAEDVVQEAFVRFWRRRQRFDADDTPLLFAMVRSASLDAVRRRERRLRREAFAAAEEGGRSEPLFDADEDEQKAQVFERALVQLPEEQREVVVLKIWGDLTFAQIASVLSISPNTAASRYRYALEAMRKHASLTTYE